MDPVESQDVSLRDYLTSLIESAERRSDARFESMKEMVETAFMQSHLAVDKAEAATERRLESMNEFRDQLRDQASSFVTTATLNALIEKLETEITRNREDLDALAKRVDVRQGEITGSRITWGNMVALIATSGVIIAAVVVLANYLSGR